MVFGPLSHLQPGAPLVVEGIRIPVPRPAGLLVEKLMTDRFKVADLLGRLERLEESR